MADQTSPTPWAPEDLTAVWLNRVLHEARVLPKDIEVAAFSLTPIGEGAGLLGELARIELRYPPGAASGPASLIAKFSTRGQQNRAMAMAFGVYAREVSFYRQIAPGLPGVAPRCYAAEYDPSSGASLLLLEDLGAYRMGDQVAGCTAAEAEHLIDLVAPLHAKYWGRVDDPELDWAPRIDGRMQVEGYTQGCAAGWNPCVERFGDVIAPEIRAQRDRFIAAVPELSRRMARPVQTLVHGDFRLDNLMFGVEPDQRPAVAIDWIVAFSAGVHDLAYLLCQNLTTSARRSDEQRLVAHYHRRLVEYGVADYSVEQAWADYLTAALYLFTYGIVIAGALDASNPRAARMMEQLMSRASAVVMDHRLLEHLPVPV